WRVGVAIEGRHRRGTVVRSESAGGAVGRRCATLRVVHVLRSGGVARGAGCTAHNHANIFGGAGGGRSREHIAVGCALFPDSDGLVRGSGRACRSVPPVAVACWRGGCGIAPSGILGDAGAGTDLVRYRRISVVLSNGSARSAEKYRG